jgi:hypothetical protein
MAINPMALLSGARALDRLFQLEKKHGAILEAQAAEIQAIKDRLTKLEEHVRAREEILVAEAKGAAAAVGSSVAAQHVSDISRRLGGLEERMRGMENPRLPPPDEGV